MAILIKYILVTSIANLKCFLLGGIENKTLFVFPGVEQDHHTSITKKKRKRIMSLLTLESLELGSFIVEAPVGG